MLVERLNSAHWTWMVYLEMFVAGVAAGAYVAATLLEAAGRGESRAARTAHLIAFPLMALATLLLIVDLRRPERFWHMAVMSERALPMFKPWSPMSLGTWLVIVFTGFTFVAFLDALIARRLFRLGGWRQGHTLHGGPLGVVWSVLGAALALAVGIYSGVLLTVTSFPGWAHTVMIPAVYVATALTTGVAAVVLVEAIQGHADPDVLGLARTNTWLIGWWLVTMLLFLITLTGGGGWVFLTGIPLLVVLGAILLAGVVPLLLHAVQPIGRAGTLALSAALVLVGGFLLRFGLIMGPELH